MVVAGECTGGVARLKLLSHRNDELEYAVGNVDDRFRKALVESDLNKL